MGITQAELRRQLATARDRGWDAISTEAERAKRLSPPGSCSRRVARDGDADVVADGGHGRGLFQIDDRSWKEWLAAHGAVERGRFRPSRTRRRSPPGSSARTSRSAARTGSSRRTSSSSPLRVQRGAGGRTQRLREGDSDSHTTGGDYGQDVLERLAAIDGRTPQAREVEGKERGRCRDGILRVGDRGHRCRSS